MKEHLNEEIKKIISKFLEDQITFDASGPNLLTSEEHYLRRSIDKAFDWLREKNHEAKDFHYGFFYSKLMDYLEVNNKFRAQEIIFNHILPIYTYWISFRCGFAPIKKIRCGLYSISLPGSVWFIYGIYGIDPVICIYPESNRGGAGYFEIGIFGRYFIRNLKLVDSIMPWIREEVKSKKYELEKRKLINAIISITENKSVPK